MHFAGKFTGQTICLFEFCRLLECLIPLILAKMEIRTFNFPIHRLSDEVNDELFWHVLEIWWTKAHCVNKRVCGADFPDGLKVGSLSDVEVEFLKKVGGIGADVELDENELKIRRLLPKDLKHFETIFEVLVKGEPM